VDLIPGVGAGTLLESELLAPNRAQRIGAIQRLDYHEAVVLTHDTWKFDAGASRSSRSSSRRLATSTPRATTMMRSCSCGWRERRR
jgi:hypothetical protein